MRHRGHLVYSVTVALAAVLLLPSVVHADVNNFTIQRFDADYTLSRDDRQGRLHIVEHIDVNFSDNNHGLLRAIPATYKHHQLQLKVNGISSSTGAPTQYTIYGSNGNTVLKIGDPNRTVTGQQDYTIDYTLNNVISFYADHDELYWDINGDQWDQPATKVSLVLHLLGGVPLSAQSPVCYTGSYGSTSRDCSIAYDSTAGTLTAVTHSPLAARQTLSVAAGFARGYFTPSAWYDTLGEYLPTILAFIVPFVLLVGGAWWLWFRRGRDPKGTGVIVPQYDAPDGLRPIEVGTVADFKTDNRDITATIIDLAIRRYITIIEQKKDRPLFRALTTYTIRLEKIDTADLNEFESMLLKALFSDFTVGQEIDLSALKYKLATTAVALRKKVNDSLLSRGYFRSNSTYLAAVGLFGLITTVGILLSVLLSLIHTPLAFTCGAVAGAIVACAFIMQLSSRTAKGVAAKEHILGLKLYLTTAEADRLKKLQSPDAPYAPKSPEPKHTVELFEKLLPYAMALGVEQGWAKQFESIYRTPPDWYSGNWTAFNAGYLVASLNSGVSSAVNTAFGSPSSSSSSGFGGGGAGGGGGGGGGGW